jgi:hypothetical protein
MTYIVTSYYRGAMHVDNLRKFGGHQETAAQEYFRKMVAQEGDARAYEVTDTAPPKRMKWEKQASSMKERAKLRPKNYAKLSARDQWDIDKSLGLLDWDGK